ncbi:YbaY family lipoprotein [Ancylobacter sp. Lp-2]|uniref:YbaY family lipoprotein n=1 Tax=Ancylobacter sp. Lp-2 TaxID=2881339 RepID=UPI001E594B11|nr:YbaY family lipoprotein [Ancylobacter sp. Lp-2]MCB4769684.1 YbaY family lipoprotein [Ancylobacter sp. Lp-2]
MLLALVASSEAGFLVTPTLGERPGSLVIHVAARQTLSGTVYYRERIALPPGAIVEVRLLDVSKADAPARTLARTRIRPQGQVPIPYELSVNAARILPGHRYALRASILVGGRIWFTSTTHHPVFAGGPDRTDILVQRVGTAAGHAQSKPATSPAGRWLAEDIGGGGVIDRLQSVLEIADDGAISGSGGCNRMTGKARIDDEHIDFGQLASTNMACTPAAMDQERKFFAGLAEARGWRLDAARGKLVLLDAAGRPVIVLARM